MKEKKSVNKKRYNILLYPLLCLGLLAFVFDNLYPIEMPAISDVAEFAQSIITVIAGIWVTGYFLFMELYKDRFPLESLIKERLPRMRNKFILIAYDIVYGGILVFFDYSFLGAICFLVASFTTIILIFVDVFEAYRTLMVSSYVSNYFKKVSASFNSHTGIVDPKFLREIKFILDESLAKEEYYTAQTIVERTGETFRDYLGNLIKLSDNIGVEEVEKSFKNVVDFNIKELDLCKNSQSELLTRVLLNEQEDNIYYCIEKKQYEWYKVYFKEFSHFVFKMQREEYISFTFQLYGIYYRVLKRLIEEERNEWVHYSLDEITSLTFAYIYIFNKNNIENYVSLLGYLLEECIKKKKDDLYSIFLRG